MPARRRLSNAEARALFLARHGLTAPPTGPGRGEDLAGLVDALGFVQVDSIDWVARAHHMILHARCTTYRPDALRLLHDRDRMLFEHWTHDASLIPMRFFPHWHLRFARNEARLAERWRAWGREGFAEKTDEILKRISEDGPCCSSDVGEGEPRGTGGWWDWHPSKAALEYLWRTGHLAVTRRDAFRKVYDLTENVVPPEHLNARPSVEETVDWACSMALDRLGFATSGELAAFLDLVSVAEARAWCARALADGRIEEVEIGCADGAARRCVMRPGTEIPDAPAGRLRILSPFDPALRDRKRAERLLGFSYRIEIFVPEARRRYGYYVFPIIEGDRMVGRIDMKAERAEDLLRVRALWPERGVRFGKGRLARLEAALARTARIARVGRLAFEDGWLRA